MNLKEMIKVMQHYENGGEVEFVEKEYDDWEIVKNPIWDWHNYGYRVKEYKYPMWFKDNKEGSSKLIVRFDDLKKGEVIVGNRAHKVGEYNDNWFAHTDKYHWEEIEEPKIKITIEKWLIKDIDNGEYFTIESSNLDLTLKDFPSWWRRIKLLETNAIDL